MSKVSLSNVPSNPRISRIRQISRTESETSCEEAARLTADADDDESCYGELPPPPDGGYGWVVVFASFMCNLIVDGIAYTFGVMLPEFVTFFGEGKGKVAFVGSILSGTYLAVGPVVSALCNKYGCRAVCIAGSIIASLAFVLSTFSTSVGMLMITYGFMGGVGFGMIYLPAVVAVGYYFETKRSLATGIAVCGSGVGTFTFAPLVTWLLTAFDWRGANLIFAGLILNCAVFGALMRPLVYPKISGDTPLLQRMAEEKRMQMERGSIGGSYFMVQLPDGSMEKRMKAHINVDPGVHSSLNLEALGGGGLPSVPTLPNLGNMNVGPTLPTITEARVADHSQSTSTESNSNGNGHSQEQGRNGVATKPKGENGSVESSRLAMQRNVSSPAFSTPHQGLPKNGSVPTFDRVRKQSTGERFKPVLPAIKSLSKASIGTGYRNNDGDTESMMYSKQSISQQPKEHSRMVRPMSRKDIFYSGSVVNLPEYQSQKSLQGYRNSVLSLPHAAMTRGMSRHTGLDVERQEQYDLCPCLKLPDSFKSALASMLDVSLLKDPVFMLIGISNMFGMAGLYVPFVYVVDAAVINGINIDSASQILSVIGITNTFGRVACGWVADFPWMDSLLLNNVCLIISTIAVFLTPFCSSYISYITMAVFFGIAISGYISLTSIILVDLLGLDRLTNAFGLLILFRGAAALVGSPLAGAVFDYTGTYDVPFYMAGVFFFISTVTSFMAPCMKRFRGNPSAGGPGETLAPIDEDLEELEEEDPEDTPITMGRKPPTITHTAASPDAPTPPTHIDQRESVL